MQRVQRAEPESDELGSAEDSHRSRPGGGRADEGDLPPIFSFPPLRVAGLIIVPQNLVILGGALLFMAVLYPDMGATLLIQAFTGAILGGFGSMPGAILGGIRRRPRGELRQRLRGYLGSQHITAAPFVIILAILVVRPVGLLGTRAVVTVVAPLDDVPVATAPSPWESDQIRALSGAQPRGR